MVERYQPASYAQTGRWLRRDNDLRAACEEAAEDIATVARGIAPVRTGAYRDSIQVIQISGMDRVGAGVEADDEAAAPIEFGNRKFPNAREVLITAANLLGFDTRDGGDE